MTPPLRRSQNRDGENGLTLLELVVAAAIGVSVLIPAAAVGIRGLTAWQRADGRLQQLFRIERELNMLGEDLRNAVAPTDLPFAGSSKGLFFVTAADPSRLLELRCRLQPQTDGTQALVRESRAFPAEEDKPFLVKTLLPRVRSFSIQYGVRVEEEERPTARWSDSWRPPSDQMNSVPMLLQIRMDVQDPHGRMESVVWEYRIPSGVLGSAADEGS